MERATSRLNWLLLVSTLPGDNGALRIRFWRAMKSLGAGSVRDGVYALPDRAEFRDAFDSLRKDIVDSGGAAYVLIAESASDNEDSLLLSLFDRRDQYASLVAECGALLASLGDKTESEARRRLRQLSRDLENLEASDFFGSTGRDHARTVLRNLNAAVTKGFSPDEPSPIGASLERVDRAEYRNRVWATRRRLWVDRVASAWLIKRFIDPESTFHWLADPRDCPADAVGFDFDGARFTHAGDLTTFEAMIAAFALDSDAALMKIGAIVHVLDVGGAPVPEAPGLETLLSGTRERSRDDDEFLSRMIDVFDSFYEAFGQS
jgi:hypothetical protein